MRRTLSQVRSQENSDNSFTMPDNFREATASTSTN